MCAFGSVRRACLVCEGLFIIIIYFCLFCAQENMFKFDVEKETFALKPMNCPGHWFVILGREWAGFSYIGEGVGWV